RRVEYHGSAWTEWMDGIEEGLSVSFSRDDTPLNRRRLELALASLAYEQQDPVIQSRVDAKQAEVDRLVEPVKPLQEQPWPVDARIVVFSVRGGSEGDYVHVEALADGNATLLLAAKTFMGRDAAWTAARRIADLLGV